MSTEGLVAVSIPTVEIYQVDVSTSTRTFLCRDSLTVVYETASSELDNDRQAKLVVGSESIALSAARIFMEPAPGVFFLSCDEEQHFYCIAVGTNDEDEAHIVELRTLLKQLCNFQESRQFGDQTNPKQPKNGKLFGFSTESIGNGVALGARGLSWGISSTAAGVSHKFTRAAEAAVSRGLVKPRRADPRPMNPVLRQTIDATSQVTSKVRDTVCSAATNTMAYAVRKIQGASGASGASGGAEPGAAEQKGWRSNPAWKAVSSITGK
eukprot:CAMPEP_0177590416 /NCGR_PEP_ID=MMETSP0419_2-20121207/7392_1 /TAXON_ID=582737 /ORGANISM="Tetraselmis sp., Strain GSL018" /LENGTH=266 /DNA_ID=CAMNT_0019080969 /DNA_START=14 /DNA_END=811 /DNA_ORIENTATION=+